MHDGAQPDRRGILGTLAGAAALTALQSGARAADAAGNHQDKTEAAGGSKAAPAPSPTPTPKHHWFHKPKPSPSPTAS